MNKIKLLPLLVFLFCTEPGYSGNRNTFDRNLKKLDQLYGQGKFNKLSSDRVVAYLSDDGTVTFQSSAPDPSETIIHGRKDGTMHRSNVNSCLKQIDKKYNRLTICLSEISEPNLEIARDLLRLCNNNGFRTIVVGSKQQLDEDYFSTYKYARIYSTGQEDLELDHNGLCYSGTAKEISEWIALLGIESVAFYPDETMLWSQAKEIIAVQKKRGGRSFSICTLSDSLNTPIQLKGLGHYNITFIPSDFSTGKENRDMTLLQVEKLLQDRLTVDCCEGSLKMIENPDIFYSPDPEMEVRRAIFKEDEFVLVLSRNGLGRNCWYKPDMNTVIQTGGKKYRLLKDEGFEDFSPYPYIPENEYANGCLCWVPERGILYNTLHFEPIPDSVETVDMVGTREYYFHGIQFKDKITTDTQVISQLIKFELFQPTGANPGSFYKIDRIEQSVSESVICVSFLINAPFTYKAYFGSDFEATLNDGSVIYPIRIEGVPVDIDYNRAGDQVFEHLRLVFPKISEDQLKQLTLKGDVCHTPFSTTFGYTPMNPLLFELLPSR